MRIFQKMTCVEFAKHLLTGRINQMSRMKTGILTLSSAQNYGAVLQSHSLCKFLNDNYSDTEIINFTPKFILGRYPLVCINTSSLMRFIKSLIISILLYPIKKKKYNRFNSFRKKFSKYGEKKYVVHLTDDDYDQYIVGSDQVFNLELTRYDEEFFLPRILDKDRKATYAASLGVSKLTEKQTMMLKKGLDDFANLSFRESTGCNLVNSILPEKKVERMIDPVFLNSKEYWESISAGRQYEKKYILIYSFVDFEKAYSIAKKIKGNFDILLISNSIKKRKPDVINVRGVGPREFLSLIKHAEFVVTDSFHGTAFSVIFNKDFYTIPYKGTESRFYDLLDLLDMRGRIIDSQDMMQNLVQIDYTSVNEKIKEQQQKAVNYFDKIYKRS